MSPEVIERRLREKLGRDRRHPSRCRVEGDVTIVRPSGTSVGLAMALEDRTGETYDSIMARMGTA